MDDVRVLVCGSRTYKDEQTIFKDLDDLYEATEGVRVEFVVIEGCAPGADSIAGDWAVQMADKGVLHMMFPAQWDRYGKAAGPIRNGEMLREGQPNVVLAYTDKPLAESRGTADMVQRAHIARLPSIYLNGEKM